MEAVPERRQAERGRSLEVGRRTCVDLGPPRRPLSPVKRGRPGQQPKQRQPKRATARSLGLWALLIFISFAALVRLRPPALLSFAPLRRTVLHPGMGAWLGCSVHHAQLTVTDLLHHSLAACSTPS